MAEVRSSGIAIHRTGGTKREPETVKTVVVADAQRAQLVLMSVTVVG